MPVLVTAIIKFGPLCEDDCSNDDPGYCYDSDCEACYGTDDGSAGCVLLKGLSAATNLELIAPHPMEKGNFITDSSKAIYNPVEQSFASKKLKRVNVKCHEVDERVNNILKSLVTYGVPLKKSFIHQENELSEYGVFHFHL
ncbi:hypothetical protein ACP4OV_015015 [Aristida adscensionis]